MVEQPEHHHWSSVHANLALCDDSLVTPNPCFIALGNTPQVRAEACRVWLKQGVGDDELIAIRQHLQKQRATGSNRFQAVAEKTFGRHVSLRRPGGRGVCTLLQRTFNFLRAGFPLPFRFV